LDKLFSIGFWSAVARFILRNRPLILGFIILVTVLLALQWKHMRFTYTEANLLPDDHEINLAYDEFLKTFGEEGNLIVLGVKDSLLFTPENFERWTALSKFINDAPEVDMALSVANLQRLQRKKDEPGFELVPLVKDSVVENR
jgi:predicted RND superfamily exporter protein